MMVSFDLQRYSFRSGIVIVRLHWCESYCIRIFDSTSASQSEWFWVPNGWMVLDHIRLRRDFLMMMLMYSECVFYKDA